MRTFTTKHTVYTFDELTEEATSDENVAQYLSEMDYEFYESGVQV
jgi:hypothetical protein